MLRGLHSDVHLIVPQNQLRHCRKRAFAVGLAPLRSRSGFMLEGAPQPNALQRYRQRQKVRKAASSLASGSQRQCWHCEAPCTRRRASCVAHAPTYSRVCAPSGCLRFKRHPKRSRRLHPRIGSLSVHGNVHHGLCTLAVLSYQPLLTAIPRCWSGHKGTLRFLLATPVLQCAFPVP